MSVTTSAIAAGRAAGSNNTPGFGGGIFGGRGLMGRVPELIRQARARQIARKKGSAVGSATPAVGGDSGRLDSIESRITALEGGGNTGSVDAAGVKTGGEGFKEMADVTSGTMPEAPLPAGSLSEAMPGPDAASMDIFGSEFARNSAVGAAKMIINKKI